MYNINSIVIAVVLFGLIILAHEIGLRIGSFFLKRANEDIKTQTSSIQAGILGMLALILGFSFNMALQRYDSRASAEVSEANAIGTAKLRVSLLPAPYAERAQKAISDYIDLRLESSHIDLTRIEERKALNALTGTSQQRIWDIGVAATSVSTNPVETGYFLQSVNDMIDAQGARIDVLNRHVPPAVFYLLFTFFISTGGLIGYATGLGQRRSRAPAIILNLLICLMVFIIIDLDRPRRGVIAVRQDSMEALR